METLEQIRRVENALGAALAERSSIKRSKSNIDELTFDHIEAVAKEQEIFNELMALIESECKTYSIPCNGLRLQADRDYRVETVNRLYEEYDRELIEEKTRDSNDAVYHELKESV